MTRVDPLLGDHWKAVDKAGDLIAVAWDLDELERTLIELGYTEDTLPAIQRVPEPGALTL